MFGNTPVDVIKTRMQVCCADISLEVYEAINLAAHEAMIFSLCLSVGPLEQSYRLIMHDSGCISRVWKLTSIRALWTAPSRS